MDWVAYLDAQQGHTSIIMTVLGDREIMQEWMENKKYSQEDLLAAVRNDKWRQRTQFNTVPETSKLPLTRKHKDTILSLIPRTLTALLSMVQTN
jgi:hypothetical protein